jgi:hypothetical protein
MNCPVWRELYEEYEKAEHRRVTQQKTRALFAKPSDLEPFHRAVTRRLRDLREHEQAHQCRG